MVRFTSSLHGRKYDATQTRLREILTDLEGVSDETIEQLERVMNLGKNRIEMRIPRSAWFLRDLRFPHS
jgi:hypothetical protein